MVKKMPSLLYFFIYTTLSLTVNCYRLPQHVKPSYYKLEVLSHLGDGDNFDFEGRVWIQVTCNEPSKNITLHSADLTIEQDKVTVKDTTGSNPVELTPASVKLEPEDDFLIINLNDDLKKNHTYEIFIPFRGTSDDGLKGFYRSSYTTEKTKEKRWLAVTQFEPTSARRAFPCFDEPAMKAVFDISIGRNSTLSSISNMPLVNTEPVKDKEGYFWDRFARSVPMSTYLVAYMVSDFGFKTSEVSGNNNVTFRIWAKKDALDQVNYAGEVGPQVLEYFEEFFDIKYPLPKQDMVAVPDFSAGAMENWGLITYRESVLLYDPKVSSLSNKDSTVSVVAHELAHQWFGNLVTMKWWTDLWLNEGFATYMASRAVAHLYPDWNSFEEEAVSNSLSVFSFDSLRTSHPVSVPIGHPDEIDEIFDTISYKKGSFLIRMMSLFLGEETLRRGVSNYLKEYKYSNAEQDDLWQSLTTEAHKFCTIPKNLTVKTVMDTWTLQTGYPLVTVTRNYKDNTADISQERFLRDEIKQKTDGGCWWVPLSYTNQNELYFDSAKPKSWLSCSENGTTIENLPDENTWVLFNIQLGGLYKVNYDEQNWKLLARTLNSENHTQIPNLNKVQLLDDAYDLAWTGNLKYEIVFDLLSYLRYEEEYLPWKAAAANSKSLNRQLKKSVYYGNFKNFMKNILGPIYDKLGGFDFSNTKTNKLDAVKHKALINAMACLFDVGSCVTDAQDLFKKYQNSPSDKTIISKELKSVIYCTAIRHGGESEWDFLWREYRKSKVASEHSTLLNALGCSREMWLLRRYLEWSITEDSGLRRQDASTVFATVADNDIGFFVAKEFFFTKIQNIYKYLSQNSKRLTRYLSALAAGTRTEEDYRELQEFIKNNYSYLKEVKQGVEQSIEKARLNVQWQHRHFAEIESILKKFEGDKV